MYVDIDVRKDRGHGQSCLPSRGVCMFKLLAWENYSFIFSLPIFSIISQPLSLLSYPHIPVFSIISSDLSLFFLILIYRNTLFFYLDSHSSDQYMDTQ